MRGSDQFKCEDAPVSASVVKEELATTGVINDSEIVKVTSRLAAVYPAVAAAFARITQVPELVKEMEGGVLLRVQPVVPASCTV